MDSGTNPYFKGQKRNVLLYPNKGEEMQIIFLLSQGGLRKKGYREEWKGKA